MPRINGTILQDFTHVPFLHAHIVYASYIRNGKAGFITFGLLTQFYNMASALQTQLDKAGIPRNQIHSDNVLAPTLFFFRPKKHVGGRIPKSQPVRTIPLLDYAVEGPALPDAALFG
jgi:hypothetical protein